MIPEIRFYILYSFVAEIDALRLVRTAKEAVLNYLQ